VLLGVDRGGGAADQRVAGLDDEHAPARQSTSAAEAQHEPAEAGR
jgi:hypothetical protein